MKGTHVRSRGRDRRQRAVERMVRLSLSACVHCAICADSCFMFRRSGSDPTYSPSYKAINSIGRITARRGKLTGAEWAEAQDLAWNKCVLCMRCYCPIGISIPTLIARARSACRKRGYYRTWGSA
jgi:Fe-S oxidoreductase